MKVNKNSDKNKNTKLLSLSEYILSKISESRRLSIYVFMILFLLFSMCIYTEVKNIKSEYDSKSKTINQNYRNSIDQLIKSNSDTLLENVNFHSEIRILNLKTNDELDSLYPIVIIALIILAFISIFVHLYMKDRIYFHCTNANCLKVIYLKKISKLRCPACNEEKKIVTLLTKCKCETRLKYYMCPHCTCEIDLFKPYDQTKLKQKIYAS